MAAITGPTGAGKSTITNLLAQPLTLSANVDVDKIKHMIIGGWIFTDTAEGIEQWRLLGKNVGLVAKTFAAHNYITFINGYLHDTAWHEIFKIMQIDYKLVLLPSLTVNQQRNLNRPKHDQLEEFYVEKHQNFFKTNPVFNDFEFIDTSDQTEQETYQQLQELLGLN